MSSPNDPDLVAAQHDVPLAGKPVLRRAVELRNPYVDALSFLPD